MRLVRGPLPIEHQRDRDHGQDRRDDAALEAGEPQRSALRTAASSSEHAERALELRRDPAALVDREEERLVADERLALLRAKAPLRTPAAGTPLFASLSW